MPKKDVRTALAELIFNANPYTKGRVPMHFAPAKRNQITHELEREKANKDSNDSKAMLVTAQVDVEDIPVEEDDKYSADWMFKGQLQKISKALRIPYQYEKLDKDGNSLGYMVKDYLLVGFEGSGGAE
jgi:hypothetical protein